MIDLAKVAESILTAPYRIREVRCGYCNGSGWAPVVREDSMGQQGERCTNCAGTGHVLTEDAP